MNSIRRKLVLVLTVAMTIVMLLGALATYRAAREEANAIFDYHLEQIALALRNQTFQGSTEALAGEQSFEFVIRVWDRNGLTIYSSRPNRPLPEIGQAAPGPVERAIAGHMAHDVAKVSVAQGAEVTLTSIFASMPCNTAARPLPSPSRPVFAPGWPPPPPCVP